MRMEAAVKVLAIMAAATSVANGAPATAVEVAATVVRVGEMTAGAARAEAERTAGKVARA